MLRGDNSLQLPGELNTAELWNRRSVLKSWAMSRTRRWKGSFLMRSSVVFWYLLMSAGRATVPGLYLCGFLTPPVAGALLRAALVASCFLGALPPVDLRAVCLVRTIILLQRFRVEWMVCEVTCVLFIACVCRNRCVVFVVFPPFALPDMFAVLLMRWQWIPKLCRQALNTPAWHWNDTFAERGRLSEHILTIAVTNGTVGKRLNTL